MSEENKKYFFKRFILDLITAFGGYLLIFFYGFFINGYYNLNNNFITSFVAWGIWLFISYFRPYAGLYYGIANLNLLMVFLSIILIWYPNSKIGKYIGSNYGIAKKEEKHSH